MHKQGANGPAAPEQPGNGNTPRAARGMIYCVLALVAVLVVYSGYSVMHERASLRASDAQLVARHGLIEPVSKPLASEYRDDNGDLLADHPGQAADQLNPDSLVLAYYEGDDEGERVNWPAFQQQLSEVTGKEVTIQPFLNSAEEIADVRAGRIQVIALHAADVPYLVNNAGYLPFAVLGSGESASGNHLLLATRPKSGVKSLRDLAGKTLVCTRPDSITGYRAAVAILASEAGLRPSLDYKVAFSFGQKRSILGLIEGEYEVGSLSADRLQKMIEDGEVAAEDLHIIYESQIIPRLALGFVHNLRPELAQQIRDSALRFENPGGELAGTGTPMRFQPIDYRRDFAFVRQIDDSFDPRFGQVAKQQRSATTSEDVPSDATSESVSQADESN